MESAMNVDQASSATQTVDDLPNDLADAISSLDESESRVVLSNWVAMGREHRLLCSRYLDVGLFRRSRQKRCQRLAKQLTKPDWPLAA
jgi:hypothetical protein